METLVSLLDNAVDKYAGRTAIRSRVTKRSLTYKEFRDQVWKVSNTLMQNRVREGDRVVVIGKNVPEYLIAAYGSSYAGASSALVTAGLRPESLLGDHLKSVDPKVILVQDEFRREVERYSGDAKVISFEEALKADSLRPDVSVNADDLSTIIFSSGTTSESLGAFKGIMLSHWNITSNIIATRNLPKLAEYGGAEQGVYMTGLAEPGHSFEYMVQRAFLYTGGLLEFTNISGLQRGLDGKEIAPHYMIVVPKLANLIMAEIKDNARKQVAEKLPNVIEKYKGKKSERFVKWLIGGYDFDKFLGNSCEIVYDWVNGSWWDVRKYNPVKWARHKIADKYIYSEIRNRLKEKFGHNLKWCIGGSAALPLETELASYVVGFKIHQGYGLSETSPVICVNLPWAKRFGSSGKPIKGVKVGIFDPEALEQGKLRKAKKTTLELIVGSKKRKIKVREGVILVKGPNVFQGYLNDPEETRKAFIEGWFNTEDLGYMKKGFLHITGRVKDIICTLDGKKTFATPIETYYSAKGLDMILVGNDKNRVGVLIVPDKKTKDALGEGRLQDGELTESVLEMLSDSGKRFGVSFNRQSISIILDFDEHPELVTRTLKPRRRLVEKHYMEKVEEICN